MVSRNLDNPKILPCFYTLLWYWFGLPYSSDCEESACGVGDVGLIPGSERSSGEGNCSPLQYSCPENPMDGGAWWATVHWVAESGTTERLILLLQWSWVLTPESFFPCSANYEKLQWWIRIYPYILIHLKYVLCHHLKQKFSLSSHASQNPGLQKTSHLNHQNLWIYWAWHKEGSCRNSWC